MNLIIIDDEKVICQGLAKIIQANDWGWTVAGTFTSAETALSICDWDQVHCVLIDISMPDIDGLTIAHQLNERKADTEIIFITAYSSFEYAQKAIEEGAISYLLKPVSKDSLKASLDKAKAAYEKKTAYRMSPEYISSHIDDLRKALLENLIFSENEYSKEEIQQSIITYGLAGKTYAIYEFLSDIPYKSIKEQLKTMENGVSWYLFGHDYFFALVLAYEGNSLQAEAIMTSLDCIFKVGDAGIQSLEELPDKYNQYLPIVREKYNRKPTQEENEQSILKRDGLPFTILQILDFIDNNLSEELSLQKVASAVYLHPTYLSNYFKKQTGLNLMNYINQVRIQEAKKLFKDPTVKTTWAMEQVGFSNRKYFEKVFKDIVGMTPTQYKQNEYFGKDTPK